MVMRRGEPKRPTPEEEQTNREVAEFIRQQFQKAPRLPVAGDTSTVTITWPKDAYGAFGVPAPGATTTNEDHTMNSQPVHKEYGRLGNPRGTLCTCEIGEDHSVNGVRLNRLPPPQVRMQAWSKPSVEEVMEKLAEGLTRIVDEKVTAACTKALIAELDSKAKQFQNYADTLREEAKKPGTITRILNAESATWMQAATYLSKRAIDLQQELKGGEQDGTASQE